MATSMHTAIFSLTSDRSEQLPSLHCKHASFNVDLPSALPPVIEAILSEFAHTDTQELQSCDTITLEKSSAVGTSPEIFENY